MSGAVRVTPSASGRGLTLSIAPAWGQTGSAAERLWSGTAPEAPTPIAKRSRPTVGRHKEAGRE